jgi:hypothetical protein
MVHPYLGFFSRGTRTSWTVGNGCLGVDELYQVGAKYLDKVNLLDLTHGGNRWDSCRCADAVVGGRAGKADPDMCVWAVGSVVTWHGTGTSSTPCIHYWDRSESSYASDESECHVNTRPANCIVSKPRDAFRSCCPAYPSAPPPAAGLLPPRLASITAYIKPHGSYPL